MGQTTSSRMEGAEEEGDSSGNSPDIPEEDLEKQKCNMHQTGEWSHMCNNNSCVTPHFTSNWVPAWTESSVADLDLDRDQDWDWDFGWILC